MAVSGVIHKEAEELGRVNAEVLNQLLMINFSLCNGVVTGGGRAVRVGGCLEECPEGDQHLAHPGD